MHPPQQPSYFTLSYVFLSAAFANASWELNMFQVAPGLLNGGLPVLAYSSICYPILFVPVILSLAEMTSRKPLAEMTKESVGEFASTRRGVLRYLASWTETLAWQTGSARCILLVGCLIQAATTLNEPDHDSPSWHVTFVALAICIISFVVNAYFTRMPRGWKGVICIANWIIFALLSLTIWFWAPRASTSQVWTQFTMGEGSWPTLALSLLVGQTPAIIGQVGVDTVRNSTSVDLKAVPLTRTGHQSVKCDARFVH
ncbi:hypothetical protein IF1G_11062 [Cordyceps javanica]|uniref:Uncharacterized protein n=1 Tax=Cordyceps javanica TaxID=43265 RepID=A0A545ULG6_9HYPO|nr:hypothetical protein IF1G_11062 [Cordyceps javanica]TQW01768.1 hypothetical protein IF2G_10750 [Cordyceps javanica]